jgi:hypothetical protein
LRFVIREVSSVTESKQLDLLDNAERGRFVGVGQLGTFVPLGLPGGSG